MRRCAVVVPVLLLSLAGCQNWQSALHPRGPEARHLDHLFWLFTWILSGALSALAGVLAGLVQASFDPNFGFQLLLPIFAAVVLGGIGSAYGALAGGLLLGVATELSTWPELHGGVNPIYKPVVAFAVLALAPTRAAFTAKSSRMSCGRGLTNTTSRFSSRSTAPTRWRACTM